MFIRVSTPDQITARHRKAAAKRIAASTRHQNEIGLRDRLARLGQSLSPEEIERDWAIRMLRAALEGS